MSNCTHSELIGPMKVENDCDSMASFFRHYYCNQCGALGTLSKDAAEDGREPVWTIPGVEPRDVVTPEPNGPSVQCRKRPVVVQAVRLTEHTEVKTLEGTMHGNPGDWLITGVKGERYPCCAAIFEETYEVMDKEESLGLSEPDPWYVWAIGIAHAIGLLSRPDCVPCDGIWSADVLRAIIARELRGKVEIGPWGPGIALRNANDPQLVAVVNAAITELQNARKAWPDMHSAHEGLGILLEEFRELEIHVYTKQGDRDLDAMKHEALQVAAMGMRFAFDVCNEERGRR